MISQYCKVGNSFNERKITLRRNVPSKILAYGIIVWQHLYSRGSFVLKASNWSRSINHNQKSLVASFVTRAEAFRGGGEGGGGDKKIA